MIDPWMSYFVARHVESAKEAGATVIVIAIKTYGGMVDSAIEICGALEAAKPVPTVAFIIDRAISAGALIALACDRIYMEDGSQIGSAQGVYMTGEGHPEPVEEKTASVLRNRFKAEAQQHGRNTALAQAMTDPDLAVLRVEVDGEETFVLENELSEFERGTEKEGKTVIVLDTVVREGELLNMTYKDAFERFRFVDGVVAGRDELLTAIGHQGARVVTADVSWSQEVARFIGGPMISGLVLSIAMLGLIMELYSPGKGIGGLVFLFGMALFFWSHFLGGQAGAVEIVFFLLGLALLAVEVFAIPGFGVFGFTGIGLLVASLVLSFIPGDMFSPGVEGAAFPWDRLRSAFMSVFAAIGASLIGLVLIARYLPGLPLLRHLVLDAPGAGSPDLPGAAGAPGPAALARLIGMCGAASTVLRPAGKVEIGDEVVDAVADAEFIDMGEAVEVLSVSGNRVIVGRPSASGPGEAGRDGGERGGA